VFSILSDWIRSLSESAVCHFLRGSSLGVQLGEPWIVCCAAAYFWNYSNHILKANSYAQLTDSLQTLVYGLRVVGHEWLVL